jgi:hypothetical protein
MKRTKKPFRGLASPGSSATEANLRIAQSDIRSLLFEDLLPTKNAGGRGVYVGGKLARYSCLTGGKLEENLDFSLRRVTFR